MDQTLPPRLPANLESAVQRVRMAARSAAEHTVDSLGLAALATTGVLQRDALLGAQYELNRKLAIFALSFNEALDTDVARQAGTLVPTANPAAGAVTPDSLVASWESLTLMDDNEVEIHISADRFALEIAHACEWEIRELDAYMGTLMGLGAAEHDRNPLRAEVVGQAMIRAIEAVSNRPEVRKVLVTEIGRSLAHAMRQTYGDIVANLRHSGVRPAGMAARGTGGRGGQSVHGALATDGKEAPAMQGLPSSHVGIDTGHSHGHELSASGRLAPRQGTASGRGGFAPSSRGQLGATMGRVDGEMMSLIRRLAQGPSGDADFGGAQDGHHGGAYRGQGGGPHGGQSVHGHDPYHPGGSANDGGGYGADGHDGPRMAAPNLIVAYRDELRQHATGALDQIGRAHV